MNMIRHQAIMIKLERMVRLNARENLEILPIILLFVEDVHPIISAGDHMKNGFFRDQSG
jgi:hypothetical protein